MMFGAFGNADHNDAIRIIHTALDAGINFIDTADGYSAGESEVILGKALNGGRRDNVGGCPDRCGISVTATGLLAMRPPPPSYRSDGV
jgi:predicted oxidoreductase